MSQHRERSFTSWEEDDGIVSFRIRLPAEQAAVVMKDIEAAKASLDGRDREDDVSAETFRCKWDGAPPDYGTMVELLDDYSRAGTPVNSSLNATSRARALASKGWESLGVAGLPST